MREQFINRYSLSKTLQFSLIPVGKTEENFNAKLLLEEDEKRAEEYEKVKGYIDRYHRYFIDVVLNDLTIDGVNDYATLYFNSAKTDAEKKAMTDLETKFRKQIAKALTSHKLYKDLFDENIIKIILPKFLDDDEEKKSVEMFRGFYTYFRGFNTNRRNMYSEKAQSTAISYRCVNDNLPKFLDNIKTFEKIKESLAGDKLDEINEMALDLSGINVTDFFSVDYFSSVLSQSGIEKYNWIIGGYTCDDGTKVQGLNELINLYNQQIAKSDKSKRLPLLKILYKQILSDRNSISFVPEKFKDDNEVISAVNSFYVDIVKASIAKFVALFTGFDVLDTDGIYIKSGAAITDLSNSVFGSWSAISNAWNAEYEERNPIKKGKSSEKYYEEEAVAYKRIESFSVAELQRLGKKGALEGASGNIAEYYSKSVAEKTALITASYEKTKTLLTSDYSSSYNKKLCTNDTAINLIKALLDSVKELERLVKPLLGTGKEENKNDIFYGDFLPLYDALSSVDKLYDKVRNYITQKPYSKDKIKLNFENPQLLGGWDSNKESDYRAVLLRKDGKYYLGIMDKANNKVFEKTKPCTDEDCYQKVMYKYFKDINMMVPKCSVAMKEVKEHFSKSNSDCVLTKNFDSPFVISKEIFDLATVTYNGKKKFQKDYCRQTGDEEGYADAVRKWICFCMDFLKKYSSTAIYNYDSIYPLEQFATYDEFISEVNNLLYAISYKPISTVYINTLVDEGRLYLFQIYNKDFSEYSHGSPNLHTLYFKALFDEKNLADVVFKLNGGSEMFFRKASIKDSEKITHPANQPINNKNPDNAKEQSIFEYELVKDKRFTQRQFSLHVPITLNFKAHGGTFINYDIRKELKKNDAPYVIGIDRGERNLIYISVIDKDGKIVEQASLNEIIGDNGHRVDYQKLLDKKEKERDTARKSWGTVENIKELKEGYISQVVHKICKLILKYDAVIAMEDLNFGFKRGRFSVEKQVYQKFENMLISKLNFLCDKNVAFDSEGGILRAYQLTNKYDGVNKGKQNGIIFYVPAWQTSKIDPVTGFVDLLHPKYTSVNDALDFFGKFDDITFNAETDMFEFGIDYAKFPRCNADFKKKWTVCTNGERVKTFRNPEKNGEWDNQIVNLTVEFKKLFSEFEIDYNNDLKEAILRTPNKDFLCRLTKLFALTLQMRNSITGSTSPEDDYLISPVRNGRGEFYDSRNYSGKNAILPTDADANGAFNIARKGLWAIQKIQSTEIDMLDKVNLSISNADWLKYVQS